MAADAGLIQFSLGQYSPEQSDTDRIQVLHSLAVFNRTAAALAVHFVLWHRACLTCRWTAVLRREMSGMSAKCTREANRATSRVPSVKQRYLRMHDTLLKGTSLPLHGACSTVAAAYAVCLPQVRYVCGEGRSDVVASIKVSSYF